MSLITPTHVRQKRRALPTISARAGFKRRQSLRIFSCCATATMRSYGKTDGQQYHSIILHQRYSYSRSES